MTGGICALLGESELRTLPVWSRVAAAARAARRVEGVYLREWPGANARYAHAVREAVELAEGSAAAGRVVGRVGGLAGSAAAAAEAAGAGRAAAAARAAGLAADAAMGAADARAFVGADAACTASVRRAVEQAWEAAAGDDALRRALLEDLWPFGFRVAAANGR